MGVPRAAVEARETHSLKDDGEEFNELYRVSRKRAPREPEIQCHTDYAGWPVPARLHNRPGAVLWRPRLANSDLVLDVPAPWWTYLVWHTPRAWAVVQFVAWEFIIGTFDVIGRAL